MNLIKWNCNCVFVGMLQNLGVINKVGVCVLQFFAHKTGIATSDTTGVDHKSGTGTSPDDASKGGANATISPGTQQTAPRRRSLDLYNEAAAILGLTCSQTNDCRCIECQVGLRRNFNKKKITITVDVHYLPSKR